MVNLVKNVKGITYLYPKAYQLKVDDLLLIHSRTDILSSNQRRALQDFPLDAVFKVTHADSRYFKVVELATGYEVKVDFIQRYSRASSDYDFYSNYALCTYSSNYDKTLCIDNKG